MGYFVNGGSKMYPINSPEPIDRVAKRPGISPALLILTLILSGVFLLAVMALA